MGLAERDGKVRLTVIGRDSFKEVIRKNVDLDAVIVTDEHTGYKGLESEFADHITINHSQLEFIRDGFSTNNVEGMFSQLKRMIIGIYHQVSPTHLHRYCHEASYRYNTRKIKDCDRFMDAMNKTRGRLKYVDLIKDSPKQTKGIN